MLVTLHDLKKAASALPPSERVELAQYLLHSLDDQEQEDAQDEWLALAERRMDEVHAGKVVGISGEELVQHLLEPRR